MTTPAKHMLLSTISQHANYKEKQLVRSGELAACAAGIIKRLRNNVRLYHCFFGSFPVGIVISQVVAWVSPSEQPTPWSSIVCFGLILMLQIPNLIRQHVLLSRFETIVAMWLYTDSDEADQPLSETDTELTKLVTSTF